MHSLSKLVPSALLGLTVLSGCATLNTVNSGNPNQSEPYRQTAEAGDSSGSPAEFDRQAPSAAIPATNPDAVQPGYLWEISSLADKAINGKYRVDFEGKLRLAYGIEIDTNGLTNSELHAKILSAFQSYLKSANQIHVALVEKKLWVDIRGLVTKPGRYLINHDASLDEVLNQAGGILPNSQAEYVQLQQKSGSQAVSLNDYYDTGNSTLVPPWQGGEIIFLQRRNEISVALASAAHPTVQIMGEVKAPGEVSFRPGADFLYYLTKAGGPSSVADLSEIEVIRWQNGKRTGKVYNWDESHALNNLTPGDIIVVHSNQPSHFERKLQTATGFAAILSAIAILVIAL